MQEEKRRRFKEALNKIYFPTRPQPPPPPPSPPQVDLDDASLLAEADGLEEERDEEEGSSGESRMMNQKLTRSQRKRLRKRKLKEAAAALPGQRRKVIGPLLPSSESIHGPDGLERKGSGPSGRRTPTFGE